MKDSPQITQITQIRTGQKDNLRDLRHLWIRPLSPLSAIARLIALRVASVLFAIAGGVGLAIGGRYGFILYSSGAALAIVCMLRAGAIEDGESAIEES